MDLLILKIFVFAFGACIGSYLNVLMYRLPRELDTVAERSNCPGCKKMIPWYENIPICSYLWLKGKCSACGHRIGARYLAVEILVGMIAVLLLPQEFFIENFYRAFFSFAVLCLFLTQVVIDLEFKLLPDKLNLYLALLFFADSLVYQPWTHWALGLAIGFGFPYLVTLGFYKYSGKVGLGGGDIKLFAALGLYLGPLGILSNIFLSCLVGSIITLLLIGFKILKREESIPFGPFIIFVAFFQIFTPKAFLLFQRSLGLMSF